MLSSSTLVEKVECEDVLTISEELVRKVSHVRLIIAIIQHLLDLLDQILVFLELLLPFLTHFSELNNIPIHFFLHFLQVASFDELYHFTLLNRLISALLIKNCEDFSQSPFRDVVLLLK